MPNPAKSPRHIVRKQVDGVWWSRHDGSGTAWNVFLGPIKEVEAIKEAMTQFLKDEDPGK